MNILFVNTSENMGGAATACNRLMQSLNTSSYNLKALVLNLERHHDQYFSHNKGRASQVYYYLEKAHFLRHERNKSVRFQFSTAKYGYDISKNSLVLEADIIHLHWINQGFLSLQGLKKLLALNKQIVWTLHDMWAFTGGCHYAGDCTHYNDKCGNCHFLKRPKRKDLSHIVWRKKSELKGYESISYVTCSKWLKTIAQSSSLLCRADIRNIPNPIDTNLYRPQNADSGSEVFLLFQSMNISDERKGLKYLIEAFDLILKSNADFLENVTLLVFGKGADALKLDSRIRVENLGLLRDENLIISMYQKSSLFVIPSLEDNLPNTIMESLACGTPVVGFDSGGIPEMIDHKINGYVAKRKDASDLAKGIVWCLEDFVRLNLLKDAARKKVLDCYSQKVVSAQYKSLYESLMTRTNV